MSATQSVGMEPQTPDKRRVLGKTGLKVVGGITAFVVTLAIVGAIWVPKLIHQAQVDEYGQVVAATDQALQQTAQDSASEEAALQLLELQDTAAREYAAILAALGATESPILVAETAAKIKKDADQLVKSLGEAPDAVPGADDLLLFAAYAEQVASDNDDFNKAVAAIEAQKQKDLEAAKDDAAKTKINASADEAVEDARALQITVNQLDLTVAQAVELLELESNAAPITPVPADQVNSEALTRAKQERDDAVAAADEQAQALEATQKKLDTVQGQVDATAASVQLAAQEAPVQAKAVIVAAPRAAADKQTAVTTAARTANETLHVVEAAPGETPAEEQETVAKPASNDDSESTQKKTTPLEVTTEHSASEVLILVNEYVTAAKGVTDHHTAVLAEEAAAAAAAEAAAAGASGYTDPNTGGWVDTGWSGGGSSGGGWSGDGGSSGGGWTGGGGSSGGGGNDSGGGSDSGGGGGTPASWFEANCQWGYNWSSAGGGTGYCYPAPDLDDDW